jgi:hypothetical protein
VNRIEIVLRVYEPLPGRFWHSVAEGSDPDLADAGEIWVGGLNIDDDKVHRRLISTLGDESFE